MELISIAIWAVASYFIAKAVGDKYPQLNIKPMYYGIGSFFLSFLGVMSYLGFKVANIKNNLAGKVIAIALIVIAVVYNFFIILG